MLSKGASALCSYGMDGSFSFANFYKGQMVMVQCNDDKKFEQIARWHFEGTTVDSVFFSLVFSQSSECVRFQLQRKQVRRESSK